MDELPVSVHYLDSTQQGGTVEGVTTYEPPEITEVGAFGVVTEGQYSVTHGDDGDAGGYWSP